MKIDLIPTKITEQRLSLNKQKVFAEQIAELLESGLSLQQALELIDFKEAKIKLLIKKISGHLQNGSPFSRAIEKEKRYFDPLFPFFLKIGEDSGDFCLALKRFAEFLNKRAALLEQIKKQLFYPSLVLITMFFSVFLMLHFFLPNLVMLFEESGIAVPPLVGHIMFLKALLQNNILLIFSCFSLTIFFFIKKGGQLLRSILEKCSFSRKWLNRIFSWRFFQNLYILDQAGFPLPKIMALQKIVFNNSFFQQKIEKLDFLIKNGNALSAALSKEKLLGPTLIQILRISEHSGKLSLALKNIANILEKEINQKINTFLRWLEPCTTIFIGTLVGLFLLGMFYPLTKILSSLG